MNIFCTAISVLAASKISLFAVADNLSTSRSDTGFKEGKISYSSSKDIKQSQKWRIWAANDACADDDYFDDDYGDRCDVWDVNELGLYSTFDCTGPRLNSGTPIDSGHHHAEEYWPKSAFDDNINTKWGGRKSTNGSGHFWVGMDFGSLKEVKCVTFRQDSNMVTEVMVQAWESDSNAWQNVKSSKIKTACDRREIMIPIQIGTEEYQGSKQSKEWRIWARDEYFFDDDYDSGCSSRVWDVEELEFYTSFECTGPRLNGGTPIASGNHPAEEYWPKSAFDGNTKTRWGGRRGNDGYLWVGMKFDSLEEVNCVLFRQDYNIVKKVRVQAWDSGLITWQNVMGRDNIKKDDEDIVIANTRPECEGLDKNECNTMNETCTYSKKKKEKGRKCKSKIKYEHDCKQYTSSSACTTANNTGLCSWYFLRNICYHKCNGLERKDCKKMTFKSKKRMCMFKRSANPCYGCHPMYKCK